MKECFEILVKKIVFWDSCQYQLLETRIVRIIQGVHELLLNFGVQLLEFEPSIIESSDELFGFLRVDILGEIHERDIFIDGQRIQIDFLRIVSPRYF